MLSSILSTASFAPPCAGPHSAAIPEATHAKGFAWLEPAGFQGGVQGLAGLLGWVGDGGGVCVHSKGRHFVQDQHQQKSDMGWGVPLPWMDWLIFYILILNR